MRGCGKKEWLKRAGHCLSIPHLRNGRSVPRVCVCLGVWCSSRLHQRIPVTSFLEKKNLLPQAERMERGEREEEWQLHSVSGLVLSLTHVLACNKNRRKRNKSTLCALLLSFHSSHWEREREKVKPGPQSMSQILVHQQRRRQAQNCTSWDVDVHITSRQRNSPPHHAM